MDKCWYLDSKNRFARGFTKRGVQFRPPTPPTLTSEEDYSISEAELSLIVFVPLVWDMEDVYSTSKGPHWFSKVVGTIELNDFI
jgi:hypothetical protein